MNPFYYAQKAYNVTSSSLMKKLMVVGAFFIFTGATSGAPIVYTGYDDGAGSLGAAPLATAAAASFDAAVSGATVVTFETLLPSDFSFSAGAVTNNSGCAAALCGFNTTSGGSQFHLVAASTGVGSSVQYNFATPIDSFGAYFSGWQLGTQTLTYTDGATEVLSMGTGGSGGVRFFGFTDLGASISSVTYTRNGDIVSVDDIRYSVVPEPTTLTLAAFALLGMSYRRRKRA